MVRFVAGEVVALEMEGLGLRPALVLAVPDSKHRILCQITAKDYQKLWAIKLESKDFTKGSLPATGYAQVSRIFIVNVGQIERSVGKVDAAFLHRVKAKGRLVLFG